jgi:hypothetical protein
MHLVRYLYERKYILNQNIVGSASIAVTLLQFKLRSFREN